MKTSVLGMLLLTSSMSLHAAPVSINTFGLADDSDAIQGIGFTESSSTRTFTEYENNNFDVSGLNIGLRLTEDFDIYAVPNEELHWDVQHSQRGTDFLGENNGNEFSATLSKSYAFDRLSLTPALGINWQDSNLVDFYHGLNSSQSIRNRDQFSGVNTNASITASYQLTKSWTGVTSLRSDFFGDSIANSPVVDGNNVTEATFGVVYSF